VLPPHGPSLPLLPPLRTSFVAAAARSGPTSASTQEFRTATTAAALPAFGGGVTLITMPNNSNVLWDTGAYGQFAVPPAVFTAYSNYFQAALQARWVYVLGCVSVCVCGVRVGAGGR
jgi:hypothetical protein